MKIIFDHTFFPLQQQAIEHSRCGNPHTISKSSMYNWYNAIIPNCNIGIKTAIVASVGSFIALIYRVQNNNPAIQKPSAKWLPWLEYEMY